MKTVLICAALICLCTLAEGQTFEIGGESTSSAPSPPNASKAAARSPAGSSTGIGWGNSIEVGRLSRAAEDALKRGNYAAAADYAQRALNAAPQAAHLWFLLGYTSRLAGRYPQSLDAYGRGLRLQPNSVEGLSGLAQTYMRLGRTADAQKILLQVIAANPRRAVDLMMAGELFMRSGDLQRGMDLLQRAEALQPNVHTEVLLATAYMKAHQPQKAKELLDRARARGGRNTDVFRAVAGFYREQRNYESAITTLRQLPNKTPDVLAELGYTYELAGKKKEAADTYVQAAGAAPNDIRIQLSAASALVHVGEIEQANQYLARAEGLDPHHYRLHAIRAEIARQQHRLPEAIREYQLALQDLPPAGPLEGVLYPLQLRLQLAEQYRDNSQPEESQQQVALARSQISQMDIRGETRPAFLALRAAIKNAGLDYSGAEADLKEALQLDPQNLNIIIQYGALLWRMKRPAEARTMYQLALSREPRNRFALEPLGYLAREEGDNQTAEQFFIRMRDAYPDDYGPYLALGDLYTALRQFPRAQQNYEKAFSFAPGNSQIVADGSNAAIEAHDIALAGRWLERAHGSMNDDPRIMRERERYLFHLGKYRESAEYGRKVVLKMPRDRDGAVYLGYDLYNLGRYDDTLALVRRYETILPREPNFPLLAGHVEKQGQLMTEAVEDYSRAIELDPNMVDAYVNRGYVLNDLQNAEQAAQDFQHVLSINPKHGVAHLGLSFSYLQLHKGKLALDEATQAEQLLGESGSTHLARAGAYRQMRLLADAEKEYRAALKYAPSDLTLRLALADTLYHLHRYPDSLSVLNDALALDPDNASIYGKMAHAHAELHHRDETLRYIAAAEREGGESSAVLLDTGDALLTLGDRQGAMRRFERALDAPDANRVDARLLIAKTMAHEGRWDDARQQISLAFAESRIGEASPVTTENLIAAANIFLGMHDFDLAEKYFHKAQDAGAAQQVIAIGLANTYIAQGDAEQAHAQLASLGNPADYTNDYDYTLALANIYRERRDSTNALTAFARANMLAGEEEDAAQRGLDQVAAQEGWRINQRFSLLSDVNLHPIFEDATIYMADARLAGPGVPLAPPRYSMETLWTNGYRVHQSGLPMISGFFQVRNARGQFSVPSEFRVISRNTWDYNFNGALNPVLRFGRNNITFTPGLQFTIRRDQRSPVDMNQNLFRQFVYMTTNPFWNWLTVRGALMHEAGPFTLQAGQHSRDDYALLDFTVGRPWGRTALLTGYAVRDYLVRPRPLEFYETTSYLGLQRKFGSKLTLAVLGEYIRTWRVRDNQFGTAQLVRPGGQFEYRFNRRWQVNGSFAWSRGQGFHEYDNMQSGFYISYVKPLRRTWTDGAGTVPLEYPLRFSIGMQEQNFYEFTGRGPANRLVPVLRLTIF